ESESTANVPAVPASGVRAPAPNATTAAVPTDRESTATRRSPVGRGAESVAAADEQTPGLTNNRIGDLNERQLKSLLDAIEHMDATPVTDPEPVTLHVGARTSSPNGL